ncbi:hypothetical protein [Sulfurospirillum multivorans]|uniref:Lipoprotein n=2 Tax=Sulfurospirillum multivorans TaxID=66821 RepID=A0AA86AK19_SULMK|nr:hypothetical protein [Sulfurospirillum multivorans]AHJ11312.1 hypothetical protein SMUL_0024 [Sulfurospirillum multivorans DSM 12446]QEH04817.1 hypothetical protein SMN_0023 [Sulfurospirillum multivorans]
MKTLLSIMALSIIGLLFSGCTTGKLISVPNNPHEKDVSVFQTNDGYIIFKNKYPYEDKPYKAFIQVVDSVVLYARANNYKYFAFVNEEFNNLNGFTVNKYPDFRKFTDLKNGYHGNGKKVQSYLGSYSVNLEVQFFKERQKGLFLYDVEEFEKDRKIYETAEEETIPKNKVIRDTLPRI